MQGEQPDDRPLFAICFQGATLHLGRSWQQVSSTVDNSRFAPKIAASLKLCLFERLKDQLKIQPHVEKKLMEEYADTL